MAVISALSGQASVWSHGYDLCRTLDLKAGTVYPILLRLAERGLVETAWEENAPQGRPARHLYRLSSAGAAFATELSATTGSARDVAPKAAPAPVPKAANPSRPAIGMAGP